jgi:hypothetical protein
MLKTISSTTNAIGALNFKGTWNANTNTPTITSSVGVKGDYYVVGTAGSTTLDGISNWGVGDWATYNGSVWQRVEGGSDLNGVNLSVSGTSTLSNLTASTALALNASKEIVSTTNTGSGNNVLATSPTLVTPNIGDASATQLSVDNIRIDGNTISSTDTNGDINLTPNGTGTLVLPNSATLGTGLGFTTLSLLSSAASGCDLNWKTGSSNRWVLQKSGAETGSLAGSNLTLFRYDDAGGFAGTTITITRSSGSVAIAGALSKGSGSFRIDHPLPEKESTHQLVHSFIEGPQIDLIYRGKAELVNGTAQINIDEKFGMTAGTFVALCRDTQCFTSNEQSWHRVRGSVTGAILTIECEDATCSDTISWMVIGERHDKHVMDTDWTDENGKVILEPIKPLTRSAYTPPAI